MSNTYIVQKGSSLVERVNEEPPLGMLPNGELNIVSEDYEDGKWIMDPDASVASVKDAEPRTLYVRRDVLNAADIAKHYEDQLGDLGALLMDPAKWHVTIAYSRTPVDWIKVGESWLHSDDENGVLRVKPGGARLHARLGVESKDAVVLQFTSSHLTYRWRDFCDAGAQWDFDDYQPHVTIAWDKDSVLDEGILRELKPWQGEIVLGPEIFEEIDENWKAKEGVAE